MYIVDSILYLPQVEVEAKDTQLQQMNAQLQQKTALLQQKDGQIQQQGAELQEKALQLNRQQRELQTLRVRKMDILLYGEIMTPPLLRFCYCCVQSQNTSKDEQLAAM